MTMHEVAYGSVKITFTLEFTRRKTLGIAVHPDRTVHVRAPEGVSVEEVCAAVLRRARWILRQAAWFGTFDAPERRREYVSGESWRYLGRQYLLKVIAIPDVPGVIEGPTPVEGVMISGPMLLVRTRDKWDHERTRRMLEHWYRERARHLFEDRLELCARLLRRHGVGPCALKLRKMPSRWGSCTPAGTIILNPALVEAPVHCVDYVIVHELCHLKHQNHGPEFQRLLASVLPDWQQRKRRLERLND